MQTVFAPQQVITLLSHPTAQPSGAGPLLHTVLAERCLCIIHCIGMLAFTVPSALLAAAIIVAVLLALFWRPLFSWEARVCRRRDRSHRKVVEKRRDGPAVQLNLNVSDGEGDPKR